MNRENPPVAEDLKLSLRFSGDHDKVEEHEPEAVFVAENGSPDAP